MKDFKEFIEGVFEEIAFGDQPFPIGQKQFNRSPSLSANNMKPTKPSNIKPICKQKILIDWSWKNQGKVIFCIGSDGFAYVNEVNLGEFNGFWTHSDFIDVYGTLDYINRKKQEPWIEKPKNLQTFDDFKRDNNKWEEDFSTGLLLAEAEDMLDRGFPVWIDVNDEYHRVINIL